ncbi:MAG TPA: mechanosensitive ion channel family protein [Rubrobacteraceae bacterium]|nr:mechanosensitive ion channel family protein [Rubrobacteraceae bacterium]
MAFPPLPLIAVFQGDTSVEETTSGIADAARKASEETGTVLKSVQAFFTGIIDYLTSPTFIANIVATVIIIVLALVFYRVAVSLIPRILQWRRPAAGAPDAAARARIKRQDTALTLIRNALRYVTFAIVALFVVSIFLRSELPTVAGASILAAVLGFGARDFLRDIIAGFFILFEGQYNVGDFITVEPTKASGLVEEFGLRTTKIRTPSGELIHVPNGTITAVTNYVTGQQNFTIEVHPKDEEVANRIHEALEEAQDGYELFLTPPRFLQQDETPDGHLRLYFYAGVLPSTEWLVEENLVERIKAAAGEDGLDSDPLVYKVARQNIQHLRAFLPPEQ